MTREMQTAAVKAGFEDAILCIPIDDIQPLHIVSDTVKKGPKYAQIAASVREVGIVEPPAVSRVSDQPGKFMLLDGHLRLEILKDMGAARVNCLIATDDEAFTYNKRVNRLSTVQEHRMILTAIERGVPEERIAKALNVVAADIRRKKRLSSGICPEAIELVKDKRVPVDTFAQLRKMVPARQVEAAELMVAMNKYTIAYAHSLLAATPPHLLVEKRKPKKIRGLSAEQVGVMERESISLEREFKIVERSYGTDHLDLVLVQGYLSKLLGNTRIVGYLARWQPEILAEFKKIAAKDAAAA